MSNGVNRLIEKKFCYVVVFFFLNLASYSQEANGTRILFEINVEGKWGFIDSSGAIVIKPVYDQVYGFRDGLAKVILNNKYGFINTSGETIVKPEFEVAENFEGPLSHCIYKKERGWINKEGEFIRSENLIEGFGQFSPDLTIVKLKRGKWMLLDKNGKRVLKPKYDEMHGFYKYPVTIRYKNKYGYLNEKGKVFIKPRFEDARSFSGTTAYAKKNGKWGIINSKGRFILPPAYDDLKEQAEGLIGFVLNGKVGFMDALSYKVVIEPRFENSVHSAYYIFRGGLAAASIGEKSGYINKTGDFVIQPEYDKVSDFYGGYAEVRTNYKSGYIDTTGRVVVDLKYDEIGFINREGSIVPVSVKGKWGILSLDGDLVIPLDSPLEPMIFGNRIWVLLYDGYRITDTKGVLVKKIGYHCDSGFRNGLIKISEEPGINYITGRFGYMNTNGEVIWKP